MKVLLVAVNAKYIHSNLGIRYLDAYTKDMDYECVRREFSINDQVERVLEQIIEEKPDVIGFSVYIWNITFIEKVANLIRIVDPSIEIFYGGPEVSYDSETFLSENVGEYVISGEGEETYREFIEFKLGMRKLGSIRGLYYKEILNNSKDTVSYKINYIGPRELMDMDKIKFPYESVEDLDNKIVYYEGSRGCPFGCKYCLSSTTKKVRFLPIERVKKELKFFIDNNVPMVKFVDRTFNCNSNFAKEIWSFVIENGGNTTFHFEISADLLKDDEIEILKKAPKGRIQFEVGVQTTNNQILKNINRHVDFKDIKERVFQIEELGTIKQHLDLIAGLPGENFESFKQSFNDVHSANPEEIQLGFLKLLKGSPMRQEAEEWGIKFSPYHPYEVLKTNDLSYNELIILKRVEEMVDKYYNSRKFNNILKYFLKFYDEPFEFFLNLGMYFHKKGYFNRSISGVDYYKIFIEFFNDNISNDLEVVKNIIKLDYLIYNKRRGIPTFLQDNYDKTVDKNLKLEFLNNVKDINSNISTNDINLFTFDIDINKFITNDEIDKCTTHMIFDEKAQNVYLMKDETVEKVVFNF
jgi:radical SAM superfamily enzyme YgiQ (UPF0313 family)